MQRRPIAEEIRQRQLFLSSTSPEKEAVEFGARGLADRPALNAVNYKTFLAQQLARTSRLVQSNPYPLNSLQKNYSYGYYEASQKQRARRSPIGNFVK